MSLARDLGACDQKARFNLDSLEPYTYMYIINVCTAPTYVHTYIRMYLSTNRLNAFKR